LLFLIIHATLAFTSSELMDGDKYFDQENTYEHQWNDKEEYEAG
jgi:hypothetical protein